MEMDTVSSQLIDVAIATLRQQVVPALSTDAARTYADLLTRVLRMVSARLSIQEAALSELTKRSIHLAETKASATEQVSSRDTHAYVVPKSGNEPLERSLAQAIEAERAIVEKIPSMVRAASQSVGNDIATRWLRTMVETQEHYLATVDPDVHKGSQVAYRGGRIDDDAEAKQARPAGTRPEALEDYLRLRFRDPSIAVRDVTQIPGGFSKTTYLVDLSAGSVGGYTALVIRQDPLVPYNCKTIEEEYELLARLFRHGYPIAEPIHLETDTKVLGSAFLISRRMPGSSNFREWATDPARLEVFARKLAKMLAQLHAIPLSSLGYPAAISDVSAGEHMRREIGRWQDLFDRKKRRPYPLQVLLLSWMEQSIPKRAFSTPATVVHGDIGFHNMLVDGGEVSCVLDWEYSHHGDPAEDLVYVKPFIEQIYNWENFKEFYYESGGMPITSEDEAYYSIWPGTRNATSCVDAVSVIETSLPDELKYIVSGYVLMPYVQLDASHAVIRRLAQGQQH
jgi:aminoglycoside phosphotransferase (APT) family kinase protein